MPDHAEQLFSILFRSTTSRYLLVSFTLFDGLRGPLVIYDPDDPLAYLYDIDDETTVITLADWYYVVAPVLNHIIGVNPNSTLINGMGRYKGGPRTVLAVVSVEYGKRYRFR